MAPRVPVPRFIGGTGRLKSPQASVERTINRFLERTLGLGGKVERYLRSRPGLEPFAEIYDTDTSELLYQDGYCFTCTGTTFAQVFADGQTILRGTISYDATRRATMVMSGTPQSGSGSQQILIVSSGGDVYVYDAATTVFAPITDFGPAVGRTMAMCEFMDGYFLVLLGASRRVYYSTLEDALTWDLTFGYFERSWAGDNLMAMKRSGRQLWLVGSKTSEVWADTGDANSPFAPIQGALIDMGTVCLYSTQRDGETLSWLSNNEMGGGLLVRATGYRLQEISTYPIALMVQQQLTIGDLRLCEGFLRQVEGHTFYQLAVPNIDTTPLFDYTEQEWVEWAMWNTAQAVWEPHIARCHAYAFERHLVGDRTSGIIYEESMDVYDDGLI